MDLMFWISLYSAVLSTLLLIWFIWRWRKDR